MNYTAPIMENWNKIYVYQGLNASVTKYYFDIIIKGIYEEKMNVSYYYQLSDFLHLDKKAICIVGEAKHLFALYILGFRRFIFWAQGVVGAESYMRNQSKIRSKILNFLEKFALKKSKICLCVSSTQQKYYEKAYSLNLNNKCLVMPCFNTMLQQQSFQNINKYKNNIFCYIGSLAIWQCFEETIKFYSEIEKKSQDPCLLKIFTKDIEKAKEIVIKNNIKNYDIKFVPQDKLADELSDCKYGFILRKDNIVNNVATPTKMSTYLANGIIPIFSSSIKDFSILAQKYKYLICLDNDIELDNLLNFMKTPLSNKEVYLEFRKLFNDYYNESFYINQLKKLKYLLR